MCGGLYFGDNNAIVVCRELGYHQGIAEVFSYPRYGQGSGPIWLTRLDCIGNETSLHYCPHAGVGNTGQCGHNDDVGVRCQGTCIMVHVHVLQM